MKDCSADSARIFDKQALFSRAIAIVFDPPVRVVADATGLVVGEVGGANPVHWALRGSIQQSMTQ